MSEFEYRLLQLGLRNDLSTFTHRVFQTVVPGEGFPPKWHIDGV